jgi:D-3-phosphoglycerate dehydrogenase
MGMVVRISDPYLSRERLSELEVKHEDLYIILRESDVISIHCLLNDETRNMFSYSEFQMMKKTAFLINTARGGILNTEDLIRALRKKEIAGAGIDVYTGKEPPSPDFPLFHMENVVLTPHISWYSEESGWSIRYKIIEDVQRHINHQPPRFVVNSEVLSAK